MPRYDQTIRTLNDSRICSTDHRILKAFLILKHAHDSCKALLEALDTVRQDRAARGALTDEEQDLLRAMLVLAAAGLDASTKQLFRDALKALVKVDPAVADELQKFVARQIRGDPSSVEIVAGHNFLARILVAPSQQTQVIEEYILALTGESLQSTSELMKAASALGISDEPVKTARSTLDAIFKIRNQIIHELDIDFAAQRRNRHSRTMGQMITHCNKLLMLGQHFIEQVSEKLTDNRV